MYVYRRCSRQIEIFAGFNVCGFCGSAVIRKYIVREHLNVTVNGDINSSSQSMTSCVTKMAEVDAWSAVPCNFTGYQPTLPQEEHTDARDRAWYMADVSVPLFITTANGSSLLLFLRAQSSLSPLKGVNTSL